MLVSHFAPPQYARFEVFQNTAPPGTPPVMAPVGLVFVQGPNPAPCVEIWQLNGPGAAAFGLAEYRWPGDPGPGQDVITEFRLTGPVPAVPPPPPGVPIVALRADVH